MSTIRSRKTILGVVFSLIVLVLAVTASAQTAPEWIEVQTGDTLGGRLERPYGDMLQQCTGLKTIPFVKKETDGATKGLHRSAIPKVIQDNLKGSLNIPVWYQDRDSLARLMSYAFTSDSFSLGALPPNDINDQIFDADFTINPATMVPSGTTNVVYSDTCSRLVSAAMDASAGYTLPIFAIKGAVKANARMDSKATLLYVKGMFVSPFGSLVFDDRVDPADRLAAYVALWNWYSKNNVPDDQNRYLIRTFDGVAVFQGTEIARSIDGDTKIEGSLGLPFASIKADGQFHVKDDLTIRITNYYTYAFARGDGRAAVQLQKLPKPDQIRSVIGSFRTALDKNYRNILEKGLRVRHKQSIIGIPKTHCSQGFWKTEIGEAIRLVSVHRAGPTSNVCEFEVEYLPPETLFNASSQDDFRLEYKFSSARPIGESSFELPAEPVVFQRSLSPILVARTQPGPTLRTNLGTLEKLVWNVEVEGIDVPGVVNWARTPIARRIQVVCPEKKTLDTVEQQIVVTQDRILKLSFSRMFETADYDFSKTVRCSVSGAIEFGRNNSAGGPPTVERTLPDGLSVSVPAVKTPTPTPTPVPVPGPSVTIK